MLPRIVSFPTELHDKFYTGFCQHILYATSIGYRPLQLAHQVFRYIHAVRATLSAIGIYICRMLLAFTACTTTCPPACLVNQRHRSFCHRPQLPDTRTEFLLMMWRTTHVDRVSDILYHVNKKRKTEEKPSVLKQIAGTRSDSLPASCKHPPLNLRILLLPSFCPHTYSLGCPKRSNSRAIHVPRRPNVYENISYPSS